MCDFQRENRKHVFTRYIVAGRLNARWEYGVLRDEIIQWREVCGDVSMPRNQDWRQNWTHTHTGTKLILSPQKSSKLVLYTKLIMEANSLWITRGKTPVGLTWCLYTLVVVRVHTHLVLLHMEGKLAQVYSTQLVVGLQVRPAPQPAVDHMRKAFSVRYLQTAIQRPAQTVQGDNETTGPIKVTS